VVDLFGTILVAPNNPEVRMSIQYQPEIKGLGFHRGYGIVMETPVKKGTTLLSDESVNHVPDVIHDLWSSHHFVIDRWAFRRGQPICYINACSIVNVHGEKESVNCAFSRVQVIIKDKKAMIEVIALTDMDAGTFLLIDYGKSNTVVPKGFERFSVDRLNIHRANELYVQELKEKSRRGVGVNVCEACGNVIKPCIKKGKTSKRAYNPNSLHCRMFCRNGIHFKGTRCEDDAIKFLPKGAPYEVPLKEFIKYGLNTAAKYIYQSESASEPNEQ
jgi:hypothetical protein